MKSLAIALVATTALSACVTNETVTRDRNDPLQIDARIEYESARCTLGWGHGDPWRRAAHIEGVRNKAELLRAAQERKSHCEQIPATDAGIETKQEWLIKRRELADISREIWRRSIWPLFNRRQDLDRQVALMEMFDYCSNNTLPESLWIRIAEIGVKHNPAQRERINNQLRRTLEIKRSLCSLPKNTRREKERFVSEGHRYSREGHRPLREYVRAAIASS